MIRSKFLSIEFTFYSIDAEENEAEIEYENDDEIAQSEQDDQMAGAQQKAEARSMPKMSWLLQIALENLGVTVCNYIVSTQGQQKSISI